MACKLNSSLIYAPLAFLLLLSLAQTIFAARDIPTTTDRNVQVEPHKDVPLTTQTIPGIGGFYNFPGNGYHQYIPGFDDTFVPNPGYEIPYPHAANAAEAHP